METFDFVIIGSGSAAMSAASKASELGVKTAVIERGPSVGGTCVNVGCVPSKHLLTMGDIFYHAAHNGFDAISGGESLKLDFKKAIESKRRLVEGLRKDKYEKVLQTLPNVSKFDGTAKFSGTHEISFNGTKVRGEKFLIATGSSTYIPPIDGIEEVGYLTNIEALDLDELPKSMIVLGGGPLGLEFAQMYSHFGTKVCVIQRSPKLLPKMEPEIGNAVYKYLSDEGIEICLSANAKSLRTDGVEKVLTVGDGDKIREYRGEQILAATGRTPNSEGLGLEEIGVELGGRGEVVINEFQQTSVDHIYAAGDVRGEPMLETTAAKEGNIVAENALKGAKRKIDYNSVPTCVFTSPQIASVGMTDAKAKAEGYDCACRTLHFDIIPKAKIIKDTRGVIKMVAESESGRILGVSIVCPDAGDLIHEATLAVKYNLTIYDIIDTVHVFPTLSESIKLVAQSYVKDVTNLPCCTD